MRKQERKGNTPPVVGGERDNQNSQSINRLDQQSVTTKKIWPNNIRHTDKQRFQRLFHFHFHFFNSLAHFYFCSILSNHIISYQIQIHFNYCFVFEARPLSSPPNQTARPTVPSFLLSPSSLSHPPVRPIISPSARDESPARPHCCRPAIKAPINYSCHTMSQQSFSYWRRSTPIYISPRPSVSTSVRKFASSRGSRIDSPSSLRFA